MWGGLWWWKVVEKHVLQLKEEALRDCQIALLSGLEVSTCMGFPLSPSVLELFIESAETNSLGRGAVSEWKTRWCLLSATETLFWAAFIHALTMTGVEMCCGTKWTLRPSNTTAMVQWPSTAQSSSCLALPLPHVDWGCAWLICAAHSALGLYSCF